MQSQQIKQAQKLSGCDSYLRNPKLSLIDSLTDRGRCKLGDAIASKKQRQLFICTCDICSVTRFGIDFRQNLINFADFQTWWMGDNNWFQQHQMFSHFRRKLDNCVKLDLEHDLLCWYICLKCPSTPNSVSVWACWMRLDKLDWMFCILLMGQI